MTDEGLFDRVLQENRHHQTPLAARIEESLSSNPASLAWRDFYEADLATCMRHRPQMGLQEAVARSLLPDAGIYLIVGFDADGRTIFMYIGKSVNMTHLTYTHAVMYRCEQSSGVNCTVWLTKQARFITCPFYALKTTRPLPKCSLQWSLCGP